MGGGLLKWSVCVVMQSYGSVLVRMLDFQSEGLVITSWSLLGFSTVVSLDKKL